MSNQTDNQSDSLFTTLTSAVRTDIPRWATISSGIVYATIASISAIVYFPQWREPDLRDLILVLVITVGWPLLLIGTVRFLDTMRHRALGFLLLIALAFITVWNNMFDISSAIMPVKIDTFTYGGLHRHDLRDAVSVTGMVAITVSIAASVLRPSRLSDVYGRLRDGVLAVKREPVKWLAVLGGVLWTGEAYSRIFDTFDVFLSAPRVGLFDALWALYWWFRFDGTYVLFLGATILVLMILYADRMQARRHLRVVALLGCCAVVCIVYAVSFPWPSEVSDYSPLVWSAPALLLLIVSAVAAMFRSVSDIEASE